MTDDVGNWLVEYGLGDHAEVFAENKIGFADLADLSEADLKELGLAAMGERKSFLRAIAAQTPNGPVADASDAGLSADSIAEAIMSSVPGPER